MVCSTRFVMMSSMMTSQQPFLRRWGYAIAVALLVVLVGIFGAIKGSSYDFYGTHFMEGSAHYADADQYARLGDALIHGSLSLDLPVPDALAELDNPYDFESRYAASDGGANPVFWDHAFYQGQYYCYFGVVPALLLYIPYQLVTGSWLATPVAVTVLGAGFVIAAALLVRRIARRFFADSATTATTIAALVLVVGGSNLAYLVSVPRFYSVPILASLLFTMLGLWFWLGARRDVRAPAHAANLPEGSSPMLSWWHLAAGSACMALNFGCRPQFMLACFLALPIFWRDIVSDRLLFSRAGMRETCAALLPFVVVIAPLLWYNYARFGSALDFGSSYNLTGFDMTSYQQSWRLTPILLYFYLLQPFDPSWQFPFVQSTDLSYSVGWAPTEPMFGGYLWLVPAALLVFLLPAVRKALRSRRLWGLCLLMLAFAAVALVVDTRTAGVTQRYFGDFGWYVMLVASLVLFAVQAQRREGQGLGARWGSFVFAGVAVAVALSIVVGGASLLSPSRYDSIAVLNPTLYAQVQGLFD